MWEPIFKEDYPYLTHNQDIFKYIRDQVVKKSESWDFFIAQQRGMGKSTIAISLAKMLDPNFSINNICFTVDDFADILTSGLAKGSVIVFDDMGTSQGGSSRKWQAKGVHELADLMQLNRTDGLITIGTSIELERSEKRLRSGFRCLISPTNKLADRRGLAIDVELRVKEIDVFSDHNIFKLWRYTEGGRVKFIRLYHPDALFWTEYQIMRANYLSSLKPADADFDDS